jgi:hypothetical protein
LLLYSDLNATIGETRDARSAGSATATSALAVSTPIATAIETGSAGDTSWS